MTRPDSADPVREARVVYVAVGSREEALRIARTVVGERLAACGNVLPGVTSVYHWEQALQEEPEVVLILKTRADRAPELVERVRALHPYDCPGIVGWSIAFGHPAYLDWIAAETAGESAGEPAGGTADGTARDEE